jgi:hypothetical protein
MKVKILCLYGDVNINDFLGCGVRPSPDGGGSVTPEMLAHSQSSTR